MGGGGGQWASGFFFICQAQVYEWPNFYGFLCERPHFSDILVYARIFRSEIFSRLLILLVLHELTVIFV